jgi:hypothetical protein
MASSSPEHHMDRLGRRLGGRSFDLVLAAEKRIATSDLILARSLAPSAIEQSALFVTA